MSDILRMLREDLDYDVLEKMAEEDPKIAKMLKIAADEVKYNTELYEFIKKLYPWQKRLFNLTGANTVIGAISANQTGKSQTMMCLLTCMLTGIYPEWYTGRKFGHPITAIAAGVDQNHNQSVLVDKLFGTSNWRRKELIGSGLIPKELIIENSAISSRGHDLQSIAIKHISGGESELFFRSYSQGREAAQGKVAHVYAIDEQPGDDFWSEALTRLTTTEGIALCSFTPLKGRTGLVETLLDLKPVKDAPCDRFGAKVRESDGWAMVRASWDDITHISEDRKEVMKKGYAAYERDARVYGMPMVGRGRVFPYETGEITYNPRDEIVNGSLPHLIGIDIGSGKDPSAAIQVAWDEDTGSIWVTDEKMEMTTTTRDLARLITSIDHRVPVAWPNDANKTSLSAQSSVSEQLRDGYDINLLGKPFLNPRGADGKKNNWKAPGIQFMNQMFAEGRLKISTDCVKLIAQLEQYSYNDDGKLQDGRDDAIDACRYAIMSIIQGFGESPNNRLSWGGEYEEDTEFHYQSY